MRFMPSGGVPALVAELDALTAQLQEAYAALAAVKQDYELVYVEDLQVGMKVFAAGSERAFDLFPYPRRKIVWEVTEINPSESPEGYIRTRMLVHVASSETATENEVNPSPQTKDWTLGNWALVYSGDSTPWDVDF